jgi:hypothetical protein
MKTSELTGAALDWAVAKCESIEVSGNKRGLIFNALLTLGHISRGQSSHQAYSPSSNWAQGGPIIEREGIDLQCHLGYWASSLWPNKPTTVTPVNAAKYRIGRIKLSIRANGPTPLIAAMRCYVASKLGDEIDIPEELA